MMSDVSVRSDDTDWLRSSKWNASIEEAFEAKLRRARATSRAQYIRIQGCHLVGQDDPSLRATGRALFRRVIEDYGSTDALQATWATEDLAAALLTDGQLEDAEAVTRELLSRRDADPSAWRGGRVDLDLSLAEMLLQRGTPNALAEADQWLDRSDESVKRTAIFRDLVLRHLVARARVAHARGDLTRASDYASVALQVAAETKPSIPRHPDVGRPAATEALLTELRSIQFGA